MASEAMRARFKEEIERGSKLPARASSTDKSESRGNGAKRKPMKRGKGFQEVPPERRGFWHGVMATKLRQQEDEPGFDGFYRCECGDPDCAAAIEGFDEARRFFVPGHVKPRASFSHRGFRFGYIASLGPDEPANIVPVTSECNKREFWNRQRKASA